MVGVGGTSDAPEDEVVLVGESAGTFERLRLSLPELASRSACLCSFDTVNERPLSAEDDIGGGSGVGGEMESLGNVAVLGDRGSSNEGGGDCKAITLALATAGGDADADGDVEVDVDVLTAIAVAVIDIGEGLSLRPRMLIGDAEVVGNTEIGEAEDAEVGDDDDVKLLLEGDRGEDDGEGEDNVLIAGNALSIGESAPDRGELGSEGDPLDNEPVGVDCNQRATFSETSLEDGLSVSSSKTSSRSSPCALSSCSLRLIPGEGGRGIFHGSTLASGSTVISSLSLSHGTASSWWQSANVGESGADGGG